MWNQHAVTPVQSYTEHMAAVKAIAWSPHHHGLLVSGGMCYLITLYCTFLTNESSLFYEIFELLIEVYGIPQSINNP